MPGPDPRGERASGGASATSDFIEACGYKIGKLKIDLCSFVLKSMFGEGSNRFALPASWLEQEMSDTVKNNPLV